jgi:D-sedoheptulose 7-phosphate isomerase
MENSGKNKIIGWLNDSIALREKLIQDSDFIYKITEAAKIISRAFQDNKKILFCGNGGSAADAQHIATEFIVRYKAQNERRALPAMALTTDTSVLTACGNDFSFDEIFSRQVEALGNQGDVLYAISTSGNSANVIRAVERAHERNLIVIMLLGGDGGKLKKLPGLSLVVPSKITSRIQEVQITIGHFLCELVEEHLFGFK